ncbi:MAG: hypothetical protein AB1779_05800 [Candidatus Thermoplasmatota archaeon]
MSSLSIIILFNSPYKIGFTKEGILLKFINFELSTDISHSTTNYYIYKVRKSMPKLTICTSRPKSIYWDTINIAIIGQDKWPSPSTSLIITKNSEVALIYGLSYDLRQTLLKMLKEQIKSGKPIDIQPLPK